MESLPPGVYDQLVSESVARAIESLPKNLKAELKSVEAVDLVDYLVRETTLAAQNLLQSLLGSLSDGQVGSESEDVAAASGGARLIDEANRILVESLRGERILQERLTSVHMAAAKPPVEPIIPLAQSALVTNSSNLNYHAVLKSELASADSVDFICPFIGTQGVRLIAESLEKVPGRKRVITSTYLGATETKAVERLCQAGSEVRIIYESSTQKTALHAKSWLFYRNSGFTTATIGSSNLSHRALVDGLEWNVRLGAFDSPQLIEELSHVFEQLWEGENCERFDASRDRRRLSTSLAVQREGSKESSSHFFDLSPHPHQIEALDELKFARLNGRTKNLVVAATGTGKTILSAFDYKGLEPDRLPKLLYIAHREDILKQSLSAYREVLRRGNFGELCSGSSKPEQWNHVFSTIQSLGNQDLSQFSKDHFDMIVVDEFHHSEAPSYRKVFDYFEPKGWLGLTATPERTDGKNDLLTQFWPPTFELRLWHALERQLLCPFNYFGIDDETDLSQVSWDAGKYAVEELDRKYIEFGEKRLNIILRELDGKCDIDRIHAVAFCTSIRHCNFMASEFNRHEIEAEALSSQTPREDRAAVVDQFREGKIRILCTVDLFNEGIDIPEIDTVLFLRPTESATVFIQQLGRGLRLCENKGVLTVLDFVGRQNGKFRLDRRFQALTGQSRGELEKAVKSGFPILPPGCDIELDRVTQSQVLDSLRRSIPTSDRGLVDEIRRFQAVHGRLPGLAEFLEDAGIELEDFYRPSRSFAQLCAEAEMSGRAVPNDLRRVGKLINAVDVRRNEGYRLAIQGEAPTGGDFEAMAQSVVSLKKATLAQVSPEFRKEAIELLDLVKEPARPYQDVRSDLPFCVSARYSRDEIVGPYRADPSSMREGTFFVDSLGLDIHLITLVKSERVFSPTTRYQDYFESESVFHWESQSTTRVDSATGRRLIDPSRRALLFVRRHKEAPNRGASPYVCLGLGTPTSHERERPIRIRYRLEHSVPDHLYLELTRGA